MRKQASESPESTDCSGGSQPRSVIGASGRPGASPGRGGPLPLRGLGLAERVSSATREGQGRSAYAGRESGHLPRAGGSRSSGLFQSSPTGTTSVFSREPVFCSSTPPWPDESAGHKAMAKFWSAVEVAGSGSSVAGPRGERCGRSVRAGGRSTSQFSLRRLEIIDLCTVLWYTQGRSEK